MRRLCHTRPACAHAVNGFDLLNERQPADVVDGAAGGVAAAAAVMPDAGPEGAHDAAKTGRWAGEATAAGVPWQAQGSLRGLLGMWSHQLASPTGFEPVF